MKVLKADIGRACQVKFDDVVGGKMSGIIVEIIEYCGSRKKGIRVFFPSDSTCQSTEMCQILRLGKRARPNF